MENKFADFETKRLQLKKQKTIWTIITVVVIAIGGLIAYFTKSLFPLILSVIIGFIIQVVLGASAKSFKTKAKEFILPALIKEEYGDSAVYISGGCVDLNKVYKAGVYQQADRYFCGDFIKASYNDIPFEMSELKLQERHVTTDSKGNRRVTYETYFSGRVIIIDFKKDMDLNLKIVEGHPRGFHKSGLEKFETELIDFNKKFDTYVNDKEKAFYILTPKMLQKLLEMETKFRGTIQYVINSDVMLVFINDNKDSLEININKEMNNEQIELIRSDLILPCAVINEFGLDKDKFNREIDF